VAENRSILQLHAENIKSTTRSSGTVHTSATLRHVLRNRIHIRVRIGDPDCQRNLVMCLLIHCQPSVKISCKFAQKLLRKVANRQTNRQTNKQRRLHTSLPGEQLYNLQLMKAVKQVRNISHKIPQLVIQQIRNRSNKMEIGL